MGKKWLETNGCKWQDQGSSKFDKNCSINVELTESSKMVDG